MRRAGLHPLPETRRPVDGRRVVGGNIRRLRKSLGLSQEGLAERSGLHWTYVGSVERGERNISIDNVYKLAAALGADVRDLFAPLDVIPPTPPARASRVARSPRTHKVG